MEKPMSLIVALKHYFGQKPGQSVAEFMAEMRILNEAEKAYFKSALEGLGYTIVPSPVAA